MTENKGDLISREALKRDICNYLASFMNGDVIGDIVKIIDNAPTVDADEIYKRGYHAGFFATHGEPERRQGEWNYIQAGMAVCPFCGASPHKDYKNFCGNCGADMRGAEE